VSTYRKIGKPSFLRTRITPFPRRKTSSRQRGSRIGSSGTFRSLTFKPVQLLISHNFLKARAHAHRAATPCYIIYLTSSQKRVLYQQVTTLPWQGLQPPPPDITHSFSGVTGSPGGRYNPTANLLPALLALGRSILPFFHYFSTPEGAADCDMSTDTVIHKNYSARSASIRVLLSRAPISLTVYGLAPR
jgi:hypothetical protein